MKQIPFLLTLLIVGLNISFVYAQKKVVPESAEYKQLKKEGKLPLFINGNINTNLLRQPHSKPLPLKQKKGNHLPNPLSGSCNCYIPPDNTYISAMAPNDDNSTAAIPLPFNFCLYGTSYDTVYINNNGNVSFDAPYFTFSADSFPSSSFVMVAPFWADVMTDDGNGNWLGQVWYKITPTALYVNWDSVGYFAAHGDLRNTFQLIITDGTDPVLPIGTNVSFCYKDMQWTTGDASGGTNGFGGTPATVGANLGDGVNYIQFGRFDQPGALFDGPYANPDGIDYLDFKNFVFDACTGSGNIPPIPAGIALCDTLYICEGDTLDLQLTFLSPEQSQTTSATVSAPGLNNFSILSNVPGNTAVVTVRVVAAANNMGYHTIVFTGTDNGVPVQSTIVNVVLHIDTFAAPLPVIVGNDSVCAGSTTVLSLNGTYDAYQWSPGNSSASTLSAGSGTYSVTVTKNGCTKTSAPFTVYTRPLPAPTVSQTLIPCTGDSATIKVNQSYASYLWSPGGGTTQTIKRVSGTYTVTVTDQFGCQGTSLPITIVSHPLPTPIIKQSEIPCYDATTTLFVDSNYVSYSWNPGGASPTVSASSGTVTVTVTDANGCVGTSPSYTVLFYQSPTADFSMNPSANSLVNLPVNFTDLSTINTPGTIINWLWNFDGTGTSSLQNPTYSFPTPGLFRVILKVESNDGCTDTIGHWFQAIPPEVKPINIFTPNADNDNDVFAFKYLEFFPQSSLKVYNRWGNKVLDSVDYKNDWDGGKCHDGVYYYILQIPNKEPITGFVTILR